MRARFSILVVFVMVLSAVPMAPASASSTLLVLSDIDLVDDYEGNVVIEENGVTLDCHGHTISPGDGEFSAGIVLEGRTGVTIRDCVVDGFGVGVALWQSNGNTLVGNSAISSMEVGFELGDSDGNTLRDNTSSNQRDRIDTGFLVLPDSDNNRLHDNTATGSFTGFAVIGASGNTLKRNTADDNVSVGFAIDGSFAPATANTLSENSASDNDFAGFFLFGASENILKYNRTVGNSEGYQLWRSSGNTVKHNVSVDIDAGFVLYDVYGNTLKDNVADGDGTGFYFAEIEDDYDQPVEDNVLKGNRGCSWTADDYVSTNTFKNNDFLCP